MSTDHNHVSVSGGARHKRPLFIAFGLGLSMMVVEIIAGFVTGSLALLSDAGHMATDALGLGMALAAITVAGRADATSGRHTYGMYRLEILAALANASLLFLVAGYVLVEAVRRLGNPPELLAGPMLVVAVVGLIVNIISWRLLRAGAGDSINVEGAYLEVLADLIGSIGVIAAALLVRFTGWVHADPLFAAAIGIFILPRAWRLGRKSLRILIEAAPEHLNIDEMRHQLSKIDGVVSIHDLHVWTLTSEMDVATLHLVTREGTNPHPIIDEATALLRDKFSITHATLQVEPDSHEGCAEAAW